jgi:hypothetical protein
MPSKKLIYFGESLGSGVAVQMATERPPGLLVLQAPTRQWRRGPRSFVPS